jgi:hypothetical protein
LLTEGAWAVDDSIAGSVLLVASLLVTSLLVAPDSELEDTSSLVEAVLAEASEPGTFTKELYGLLLQLCVHISRQVMIATARTVVTMDRITGLWFLKKLVK